METPLDIARLTDWAEAALPMLGDGPVDLRRLAGGSSSAVFRLCRGGTPVAMRLPVWPPRADSLSAMAREAKVLGALAHTAVPHARLLAYVPDANVVGTPLLAMAFVDGWIGTLPPPPFDRPGPHRREMAFALVEAIAAIGIVDPGAVGLGDLGRPDGFLDRQVDRWLAHLEGYRASEGHPGREIPGLQEVADWLRAHQPRMQRVSLMHADASFPNVMFTADPAIRVAAVIDWEIATLGDPLLDLGRAIYALPGWRSGSGRNSMADFSDMPPREELAAHYAALTGLDVSALDYYVVLAAFKLACIIEFNYARMVTGRDTSRLAAQISDYVVEMITDAAAVTRAG